MNLSRSSTYTFMIEITNLYRIIIQFNAYFDGLAENGLRATHQQQ